MFGMSMAEMTVVAIIALVILGPEKLPEVARMAGRGMRELRKASNLFRDMLLMEEAQHDAKKRAARRVAEEEQDQERLSAPASGAAAPSAAASKPARPVEDDLDFMGPLDGPEDELPMMEPPQTRHAPMNPVATAHHVRQIALSPRKLGEVYDAHALLSTESWREVHLHTKTGELWR